MADLSDTNVQELISVLYTKRAILFVGAGSSRFVGYPLWGEFVHDMGQRCTPPLTNSYGEDLSIFAGRIKEEFEKKGLIDDYYNGIQRAFEPKGSVRNHDDLHVTLVKLGFCGLVTTNYDSVLESAVAEALNDPSGSVLTESIDLCARRILKVSDFLRSLTPPPPPHIPRHILHLHGHHRDSDNVILTRTDYKERYGDGIAYDEHRAPLNRGLDTLHRKVLWSLLAMHPLVFVGFSMEDEFFTYILGVVQQDLQLGTEPVHFAIFGNRASEDLTLKSEEFRRKGITPIFYPVPEPQNVRDPENHDGLKRFIFDLAAPLGISIGTPSSATLTRKMLEL